MDPFLLSACNGKSASRNGLNMPEFKKAMIKAYPSHSDKIKLAKRKELEKLCLELLNKGIANHTVAPKSKIDNVLLNLDQSAVLGKGAFGTTYKVLDQDTGSFYVLKALKKESTDTEQFMREYNVMKHLFHNCKPYVTCVVDKSEDKKFNYLLMDYIENYKELSDYMLAKDQPFTDAELLILMKNLANGLKYIHDSGVVHRDIKPANIIINKDNDIRFIDFGGSCISTDRNCLIDIFGSPIYMPPEINIQTRFHDAISKSKGDMFNLWKRSDVWELGMVFYQLLQVGHIPVGAIDNVAYLLPVPATDDYIDVYINNDRFAWATGGTNENFSNIANSPYRNLLEGMLAFDPENRYSIDDVIRELDTI